MTLPSDGLPTVTRTRVGARAMAVTAGCLAVLGLLGAGVTMDFAAQLRLDAAVSEALYVGDHRAAALDWLLEVLTAPGLSWVRFVVFLPVLVALVRRGYWWTTGWLLTAVAGIGPLTTLLKQWFGRVRPAFEGGGARYESLSFPSGHASGIATLATVALLLAWPLLSRSGRRRALLGGVVVVLLVGLTRMLLGVHFLSDVVGGWSLGVAWTLLTAMVFGALPGGRAALRRGP